MSLTHRDTKRGPVLRLPWALLLAPVFLVGFLAVLGLIVAVQVLLTAGEALAELRRAGRGFALVATLTLGSPDRRGAAR